MIQRNAGRGMGLFFAIWLGQVVSSLGTGMTGFALGVEVFQNTGSVTRFALISLSVALPILLLSPLAGVVADRFNRRMILIASALGSAVFTLVLYRLVVTDTLAYWHIYPLVAIRAAFGSFTWPTFSAATTLMVGKENFARASGMNQMGAALAQIAAPMLGALLLVSIGLKGVLLLDFATFLFTIVVLLLVRIPQPTAAQRAEATALETGQRPPSAVKASGAPGASGPGGPSGPGQARPKGGAMSLGWRFVRERPGLLNLLLLFAGLNFCVGFVQVLIAPLVLSFSTPQVLGLVMSLASSGTLVGGIAMTVWGGPRNRIPVILTLLAFQGLLLTVGGFRPSATLVAAGAFCFLLGFPIIAGSSQAIWQTKTPPALQGRVFAMRRMIAGSSIPFAQAVAGPLADYVFEPMMANGGALSGTVGRLLGVGPGRGIGLMLVLAGVSLLALSLLGSRLRSIRRLEQDVPDAVDPDSEATGTPPRDTTSIDQTDRFGGALASMGRVPAWAALATIVLLAWAAVGTQRPPAAAALDAPPGQYSAARAFAHVEATAQTPHPVASAANRAVRDYIVEQMRGLGLEVEIQRGDNKLEASAVRPLVTIENVVARLRGTGDGGRAILLSAHYDSAPSSPGAADNGASIATLIETARALVSGSPLRNDVVFLFTDAEEAGLHGARYFVKRHPWARQTEVVLNFDARGAKGPAYMFQTGPDNGWWIPRFVEGAPRPFASSLMDQIYQRLPNATDFVAFRSAGLQGFDLAFIDGLIHYHSGIDTPEALSRDSLQHHGSYALGLARHFGDLDLEASPEARRVPNRVYFNVLGRHMVHYPQWLAWVIAALAFVAFGGALRRGLRSGRLSLFGLVQGFLTFLAALVALPVAVTLGWLLVRDTFGVPVISGGTAAVHYFLPGFAILLAGLFLLVYRFFRRAVHVLDLTAGALLWWALLLLLTCGPVLPIETSFLAAWPLLFASVGLFYLCSVPLDGVRSPKTLVVLTLASVPALLLLTPISGAAVVALQSLFEMGGPPWMPFVLLLGAMVPLLEIAGRGRSRLALVALAAGVVMIGLGATRTDPDAPTGQSSVLYAYDVDAQTRQWFSFDPTPVPWTAALGFEPGKRASFRAFFPLVGRPLLVADAPVTPLGEPEVRVRAEREANGARVLDLDVAAARGARARLLYFEPLAAVTELRIDGTSVSMREGALGKARLALRLPVGATERVELVLAPGRDEVTMVLVEQVEGLPEALGVPPRPEGQLVRPSLAVVRSDVTLIRKRFELPSGVPRLEATEEVLTEGGVDAESAPLASR